MRHTLQLSWPALAIAAVAAGGFLSAGWSTMPMDDAYIHLVYARNLAEHGRLSFNLDPPDQGLGTTSILWPLSLAALHPVMGVVNAARLLGLLAWLATVLAAVRIAAWMVPDRPWRVGALVALSGNLIWFSLSGMETMLWMALGLWAVVVYRERRFTALGGLLGLLMLTRIEGLVLLFAIVVTELLVRPFRPPRPPGEGGGEGSREGGGEAAAPEPDPQPIPLPGGEGVRAREGARNVAVTVALALALLTPWLLYCHQRSGTWLPTSYAGKKHAQVRAAVDIIDDSLTAFAARTGVRLPSGAIAPLIFPLGAVTYGVAFVAGAAYLPGPRLGLPGKVGGVIPGLSLTGLLALALVFLPTLLAALRQVLAVARAGLRDPRRRALLVLAAWFIGHNLAYWLKLPTPGTASRYQVVNHVAVWLLCGAGALRLTARRRQAAYAALLILALWNALWWRGVYASDIRHMQQVRLASAEYIRDQLPPDAVIAAHDIGALGWAMQRHCLDLGGLIDPAWLTWSRAGRGAQFLRERGATHLVLPTQHSSESSGFFDYAAFLGLKDNPAVRCEPVRHFENDRADWARGAISTWNALPGVTVYRLVWIGEPAR